MSAHEKFVRELRAPVSKYFRKQSAEQRRKVPKAQSSEDTRELTKKLEAKFDELFNTSDD